MISLLVLLIVLAVGVSIVVAIASALVVPLLIAGVTALVVLGILKIVNSATKQLPNATKDIKAITDGASEVFREVAQKVSTEVSAAKDKANEARANEARVHPHQSRPAPAEPAHTTTYAEPAPRPAPTPRRPYRHFDADEDVPTDSVVLVMHDYEQNRVVGRYARDVIHVINSTSLQGSSIFMQIDDEFEEGTISWDRFVSTATKAIDAIERNCALLANRVQTFDVDEYERMERYYVTGGELKNGKQDPARIERWALLRDTMTEMDDLHSANEGLLLELNKLSVELAKLSRSEVSNDGVAIAEEVSRLANETKYYR